MKDLLTIKYNFPACTVLQWKVNLFMLHVEIVLILQHEVNLQKTVKHKVHQVTEMKQYTENKNISVYKRTSIIWNRKHNICDNKNSRENFR